MKYIDKFKYSMRGRRAQRCGEPELKLIREMSSFFDINLSFDIGGNMGEYAYTFEQISKNLVILEPIPSCCEYLSNVTNVQTIIVQAAVSDVLGKIKISVPIDSKKQEITALATLNGDNFNDRPVVTYDVNVTTLTDLVNVFGFPDIVKIDVEGAEYSVLSGANLAKDRFKNTVFIIEVEERHTNKSPKVFFNFMKKYGFDAYAYNNRKLIKLSNDITDDILGRGYINFIFFKDNIAKKLNKLLQ